jgi:hypothetical protein
VRKRDWLLGVNVFVQKAESRKQKAESRKQKAESRKKKEKRKEKKEWSYKDRLAASAVTSFFYLINRHLPVVV